MAQSKVFLQSNQPTKHLVPSLPAARRVGALDGPFAHRALCGFGAASPELSLPIVLMRIGLSDSVSSNFGSEGALASGQNVQSVVPDRLLISNQMKGFSRA